MTTYTKGPWRVKQVHTPEDDYGTYYYTFEGGKGYLAEDGTGFYFSGIIHPNDANLIAAAPEMYEALKAVIDEDCEVYRETWVKIKTAMNKVEGRKV